MRLIKIMFLVKDVANLECQIMILSEYLIKLEFLVLSVTVINHDIIRIFN